MKKDLQELIEITTSKLGLPSFAFVEKDLYITQVLHAINQVDNKDFHLVFIGGTCLTKAHKIIQRMSEDLDFKVVPRDPSCSLKTQATREKLSRIREEILQQIKISTGFSPKADQINKGNNNRFTQILLDYNAFYPIHDSLRTQIKIELTAQVMQLPSEKKCVASLIYETLGEASEMSSQWMNCTSTNETAIEKWSALCRYASSVSNQVREFDPSIVRHLYDLYCIEKINQISSDFEKMAPFILKGEIERIRGQNPLYNKDPISEVQKGIGYFSHDATWRKSYDAFINSMVFQKNPPTFQETLEIFESLHERAIKAIQQSSLFKETSKNG